MALSDSLTSYWKFDENTGTNVNDEVTTNDLTLVNTPAWTASGKISNAVDFEASSTQYATTSYQFPSGTGAKSVSVWYKPESKGSAQMLMAGGAVSSKAAFGLCYIYNANDQKFWIWGQGADVVAAGTYPETNWYHVVATDDGAGVRKLYVNGALDNSTTDTFNTTAANAEVGRGLSAWAYADGIIDEIGVWSRALSLAEVQELYNSGSGVTYPFSTNITITPSALTLSLDDTSPLYLMQVEPISFSSGLVLNPPQLANTTVILSNIVDGTGTRATRFVKTSWDRLTALDPTKEIGIFVKNLVPESSSVPQRQRVGIN